MNDDTKAINTPLCYGCDYADYDGKGYCYMFPNQPFVIPCAQYTYGDEKKEANHACIVTNVLYQDIDRLQEKVKELEAENRRLAALNDMFPPEIARLEDRVSEEYEAERADDRARIQELEAEVGRLMLMNPCNHTGFESAPCDICGYPDPRKLIARLKDERADDRAKIEELKKENRRLRELVDGATVAVELFKDTAPAQKKWREEWLNKAREALKEARYG